MCLTCQAHCPHCRKARIFESPEVSHLFHLVMMVCSLGLWTIAWLAVGVRAWLGLWECRTCHRLSRLPARLRRRADTHRKTVSD